MTDEVRTAYADRQAYRELRAQWHMARAIARHALGADLSDLLTVAALGGRCGRLFGVPCDCSGCSDAKV